MHLTNTQKSIVESIYKYKTFSLLSFLTVNFPEYKPNFIDNTFHAPFEVLAAEIHFSLVDYVIVISFLEEELLIIVTENESVFSEVNFEYETSKEKHTFRFPFLNDFQNLTIFSSEELKAFIDNGYKTKDELEKEKEDKHRRWTLYVTIGIAVISTILSLAVGYINIRTASKIKVIIQQVEKPIPITEIK